MEFKFEVVYQMDDGTVRRESVEAPSIEVAKERGRTKAKKYKATGYYVVIEPEVLDEMRRSGV